MMNVDEMERKVCVDRECTMEQNCYDPCTWLIYKENIE